MNQESDAFPWEARPDGEAPSSEADMYTHAEGSHGADSGELHSRRAGDAGADPGRTEPPATAAPPARQAPDLTRPARGEHRQVVRKEYYSISEVADLVGLPAHVLRYWESQFAVLNPSKNRSGNRVYQRKEIKLILLVKQLLHVEKYTVEGAKQRLEQLRRGGEIQRETARAMDEQMVATLREELQALSELLSPERS